jgi:hypothetical protein
MNDVAKQAIANKLEKALEAEHLNKSQATRLLGLKSSAYLSMVTNHTQWKRCPASAWEVLRKWGNSGESLVAYGRILEQIKAKGGKPSKKESDGEGLTKKEDKIFQAAVEEKKEEENKQPDIKEEDIVEVDFLDPEAKLPKTAFSEPAPESLSCSRSMS